MSNSTLLVRSIHVTVVATSKAVCLESHMIAGTRWIYECILHQLLSVDLWVQTRIRFNAVQLKLQVHARQVLSDQSRLS